MKRLSILLALLTVLTLFAACSDGGSVSTPADSSKDPTASVAEDSGSQTSVLKDGTVA